MIEVKSNFYEFLNYQIVKNTPLPKRILNINRQLNLLDYKLLLRESALMLKGSMERKKRRKLYLDAVNELDLLIKKRNEKRKLIL